MKNAIRVLSLSGWMTGSFILMVLATSAISRADQVFVLSGGDSPTGNHYSQYLQTKTLTDQLRVMLPQTNVSVMFGAGNAVGAPPVLADVHRVSKVSGTSQETMQVGAILKNQAATRANVESFFKSPAVSSMKKDETFFMLVSDHGMPNTLPNGRMDTTFSNNCINLWNFESDLTRNGFRMGGAADRCFSKDDLKKNLTQNVPAKRSVFAMSQCFSGGFHKMSVDLSSAYPKADAKICGFTAVTEDTTASGCTPDVDGPGYQGYERSFTEQLTGVDVVSGQRLHPSKTSFREAHEAAAVQDFAKDIPLATSDFFLWKWALAIEQAGFVPRASTVSALNAVKALRNVSLGGGALKNGAYLAKEAFFVKMQGEFDRLYPEYSKVFRGPLADHEALVEKIANETDALETSMEPLGNRMNQNMAMILDAWSTYVQGGGSKLSADDVNFETKFFGPVDRRNGPGASSDLALYMMSSKTVTDPAFATKIGTYRTNRMPFAIAWALASGQPALVAAATQVQTDQKQGDELEARYFALQSKHGHVRRLLIYRQVLGAWAALTQMADVQALGELKALLECESAKLP